MTIDIKTILIIIAILVIIGLAVWLIVASKNKKIKTLKSDNKHLHDVISVLKEVDKIEDHAINELQAIMRSKAEIEKVNNAKKRKLMEAAGSSDIATILSGLSD